MKQIHLFDEAYEAAMNRAIPAKSESIPLSASFGRYLTEDIFAKVNVPPFDRAMMDGYAVRACDTRPDGNELSIIQTIIAGEKTNGSIQPGEAIRIMTGAPVPHGADAIARFEWCDEEQHHRVKVLKEIKAGESVQHAGEDGHVGQCLLHKGTKMTGSELAVCKTFGIPFVPVAQLPKVCILVTGNELVEDAQTPLQPGQIYGANEMFIQGALAEEGIRVSHIEYIEDDKDKIREAIQDATKNHDYVIVTGGISAGDLDFVPSVIKDLTGNLDVEKVLMRPGAPFIVSQVGNCTVFALSGNPAASFIQFETLVRPVIRTTLGMSDAGFALRGTIVHDIHLKPIKHTRILRAAATYEDGRITIDATMAQSPGVMSGFAFANCLVRLNESSYNAGSALPIRLFKPIE